MSSAQNTDRIIIPLNKWSSQRVLSKVVGQLIEETGVKVAYENISANDQWGALRQGIIHVQIEVWQPSMADKFNSMVAKNLIVDAGTHSAIVREEWWYPEYTELQCPDLPNWQAMNKCAHLFSHATHNIQESTTKGIYYTGPWNYSDGDIIRALKLNFSIKRLPDDKALWKKLNLAIKNQRPIMLLNWSPNWTDARIKGKFVDFPTYTPECEINPEWGHNKTLVKDCGNPKTGWLKKAVWIGFAQQWPSTYKLIQAINFDNEMVAEASALVVVDGYTEEQAANIWLKKYNKQTSLWLDQVK